jgi:Predicted nucleic acid-binding protein, contains PIN domain
MIFDDLQAGDTVFIDANTFIYHFTNHPKFGPACTRLMERIENGELHAATTTACVADVVHRLMTIEAMALLAWPATRLAARLKQHHDVIPRLSHHQAAAAKIGQLGINVFAVVEQDVLDGIDASRQFELLTGDALIVAAMRRHSFAYLASGDADFDRVAGITRCGPV